MDPALSTELSSAWRIMAERRNCLIGVSALGAVVLLIATQLAPGRSAGLEGATDRATEATGPSSEAKTVLISPERLQLDRPVIAVSGPDPFQKPLVPLAPPINPQPSVTDVLVATPTPAEPIVPPMPYRFFGQVQDAASATRLFLARENQLIPIKVGEVLDGQYRVAAITESSVDLVYLPLNQVQQIGR
jgi:hypothetical protein